jgi:hypothetical protein
MHRHVSSLRSVSVSNIRDVTVSVVEKIAVASGSHVKVIPVQLSFDYTQNTCQKRSIQFF